MTRGTMEDLNNNKMAVRKLLWKAALNGKRCPSNMELAFDLNISADKVRAALNSLELDGTIRRKSKRARRLIEFPATGHATGWTKQKRGEYSRLSNKARTRECMCCRKSFESTWSGHRLCNTCSKGDLGEDDWHATPGYDVGYA